MAATQDMTSGAPDRPCGYAQYPTQLVGAIDLDTAPTTGVRLSACKGKPNRALFIAETQDVRWRDDGSAPTAALGMLLPKGVYLEYTGDLSKLQFFQVAATAVLNVTYYNS